MVQYERRLKRKMQSIIYEANRREMLNEVFLGQCEQKRKKTEDKLNNLRAKLSSLLQKLQLVSDRVGSGNELCEKTPPAPRPCLDFSPNSVLCLPTSGKQTA